MKLSQLIESLDVRVARGETDVTVVELTDDSRQVSPGSVFVARSGSTDEGRRYIDDAVARGAAAVIVPGPDPAEVGRLAERFFGEPAEKLKLIAVTGTNGKSTTCFLIQHLLENAGMRCGLIGTIRVDDGTTRWPASLTTPGPIEFSRILAKMVKQNCGAVVCEVSSHALDQNRVAAIDFDVAVFTNLTGDHLDYHKTMDAYAEAKAKLFQSLSHTAWAVVNRDDAYANTMLRDCKARPVWTTLDEQVDSPQPDLCCARVTSLAADHSRATFTGPWGSVDARLPLVGRHNMTNTLQAITAANCVTAISRTLRQSLPKCPQVPGRLERVEVKSDSVCEAPSVLVDYAHTHDSLENVLTTLGPITHEQGGKLICLFGCGGDRDVTKRPKMAVVACRWADEIVITSDNPRREDPDAIMGDILSGIPQDKQHIVTVLSDRAEAIAHAIQHAGAHDTVLLAGKGHEDYQIIADENGKGETRKIHFDDREHAQAALERWHQHHAAASL